jgi:hypothetical protein
MKRRTWVAALLAAAMLISSLPVYGTDVQSAEPVEEQQLSETETSDTETPEEPEDAEKTEEPEETENAEETEEPEETENAEDPEEPQTPEEPEEPAVPSQLRQDHSAYMQGVGGGYFSPDGELKWEEACQILYNLLEDQSMGTEDYPNISAGQWYYQAVVTLASRGILENSNISIGTAITRAEFTDLVVGLVGVDTSATCSFTDLTESHRYYAAVATAVRKGWIQGNPDGTFQPDAPLTRAQAVTILNRVLGRSMDAALLRQAKDLRAFRDVSSSYWGYGAILEATIDHEATQSQDGSETWSSYTHSYAVSFTYSGKTVTELVYEGEYPQSIPTKDAGGKTITHWILPANGQIVDPASVPVYEAASYTAWYAPSLITSHTQYIEGLANGTFQPDAKLTRAEAVQLVYRLLDNPTAGPYPQTFYDEGGGKWYTQALAMLSSLGLVTSNCYFRANDTMTRGEFVELVTRLVPYTSGTSSFSDVKAGDANYQAIVTAAAKGWINGYSDGTFRADEGLTRAQAVKILNQILGRTGDSTTESQMDSRYTFPDVSKSHWAYNAIMEAATTHTFTWKNGTESWSGYTHNYSGTVNWESSDSVVQAARITNTVTSTYGGDFTHNYNVDYSTGLKEKLINQWGYSSDTNYLVWISRQNQKVYVFNGSKGKWTLTKTFICGTGALSTPTPVGLTKTTYKETGWYNSTYSCRPVVRFYPNTGYAFHSRLYYPNGTTLKDSSIGWPVSAGCIRMLDADINYLYKYLPNGSTVLIY